MKKLTLTALGCCLIFCLSAQNLFSKLPHKVKKELKDLKYVQGGSYNLNVHTANAYYNTSRVSLSSYYLSAFEVSNADWKAYYKAMETKYGKEGAKRFLPDTAVWTKSFPYAINQPMTDNYYNHPAYSNYPVVGITWNQAVEYCEWKTQKINDELRADNITNYTVKLRLPLKCEWEYATATPLNSNYSADGAQMLRPQVKKIKKKQLWNFTQYNGLVNKRGYQANFGSVVDSSGYIYKSLVDDGGFYTVPVRCYLPNDLGMCNLQGNVEEWVSDKPENTEITKGYARYLQTNINETNTEMHLCKGGSWVDTAYYLATWAEKSYPANTATPFTGFRLAMDIIEVKPTANNN